jgi:hypothetical protein
MLYPIINGGSSKNVEIQILRDKPIGLIKWRKAELENLHVSHLLQKKNYGDGQKGLSEG